MDGLLTRVMFDQKKLFEKLTLLSPAKKYLIAYSGGLDSHVLLHAMAGLRAEHPEIIIKAVHINHDISTHAKSWEQHCQQICQDLKVPFVLKNIVVKDKKNLEANLRHLRYQAIATELSSEYCLLTAHHKNDQAETLLLQLLRGAGVGGLAAMSSLNQFATTIHLRPLLDFTRSELQVYAVKEKLCWIEDESNYSLDFDRNYLRQKILPLLQQRWPGSVETIVRSSQHCANANDMINVYIKEVFIDIFNVTKNTLSIQKLLKLNDNQQSHLLRYWLQYLKFPLPNQNKLLQIQHQILSARLDANPIVTWNEVQIRRYHDDLYAVRKQLEIPSDWEVQWDLQVSPELILPGNLGKLTAKQLKKGTVLKSKYTQVTVRFRRGGERCQPGGRIGSHPLKKLLQEWQVPTWQRNRIPLIYIGETLAVVVGYCISKDFVAEIQESGWQISLV